MKTRLASVVMAAAGVAICSMASAQISFGIGDFGVNIGGGAAYNSGYYYYPGYTYDYYSYPRYSSGYYTYPASRYTYSYPGYSYGYTYPSYSYYGYWY